MLRRSIALGRRAPIGANVNVVNQRWRAAAVAHQNSLLQQRYFADAPKPGSIEKDSILSSDPAFLPGSQSSDANPAVPPPPGPVVESPVSSTTTPVTPTSSSAVPENVPLTPPPPPKVQTSPPSTVPPTSSAPPPPPPPPKKPKRRGRKFLLYTILGGAFAYGGGVAYALNSDNFHDFFTEYVPYGEEAVLYFEELQFQQRFPHAKHHSNRLSSSLSTEEGSRVTIPSRSGISWKVKDEKDTKESDAAQKGRHMSALDANKQKENSAPSKDTAKVENAKVEKSKKETPEPAKPKETPAPAPPTPAADERKPAIAPVTQISPLSVPNASEPVVQELVKTVNDLITVINSDSDASNKYSQPIEKAKESLAHVGSQIVALKEAAEKEALSKIEEAHKEFEERARSLISQIDLVRAEETAAFREQFEAAREQLAQSYNQKLKLEIERSNALAQAKLKNELMEQAIELKRKFVAEIQSLVEQEREGRLSKLSDLSSNVSKLQELTSDWNGVIDTNLATQKLQVAVDAVKSTLERAAATDGRPHPFVRELAALKEVANGDPVVEAAIASINPVAYQRGIPSTSQLIDRFRRVAQEVRKASLLPEDAGLASHAASLVLSKVLFKKHGLAEGDDPESILTRTETFLEEGNLDAAAREMNTLQGWAKTLSKDWLADIRRVLEVQQALEVIETEARLQCLRVE